MGKTSNAVKTRYNKKAYKMWNVRLKPELFEALENIREDLSRSQWLSKMVELEKKTTNT